MDLSSCAINWDCNIIVNKGKTQFIFRGHTYEVPFLFPITTKDGCLFGKEANYIITKKFENGEITRTEVFLKIYCIELYEDDFDKAFADFRNLISLDVSVDLLKESIIKALLNLLDISIKSYNKAYDYLVHSPYSGFQGSFRQYCEL